jgi:transcriptional regulator with XRE-family HTH domain
MDTKKIKKLMIDLDLSMGELARRAGYTRQHLNRVLYGRYHSETAQRRILAALAAARDRQAA